MHRSRQAPVPLEANSFQLPLFSSRIRAGFPNPADDYIEEVIDLNDLLIRNQPATFMLRVAGDSMIHAGIWPNDILLVDRSLEAQQNDIIVAAVEGDYTVKRFVRENGHVLLMPANPKYQPIKVTPEMEASIFGVVTFVLHRASRRKR
jgi:DNA polymerase V